MIVDGIERFFHDARYNTHAAADFHGIGGDHGLAVSALVGEFHDGLVVASVKEEVTKVNPRAAAHLLVDHELARTVGGVDGVVSVGGTVLLGDIAHVHGILASSWYIGLPHRGGELLALGHGSHSASGPVAERVLRVHQVLSIPTEAGHGGIAPLLRAIGFGIARGGGVVGIDDDFGGVGVAFAGADYISARVLKHGHQEGHHVALSVEVFHGLEDTCTLPFPAVELGFEVPTVALPHGDDAAIEACGSGGSAYGGNEGSGFGGCAHVLRGEEGESVEVITIGLDYHLVVGVARAESGADVSLASLQGFGGEGDVGGGLGAVHSDGAS